MKNKIFVLMVCSGLLLMGCNDIKFFNLTVVTTQDPLLNSNAPIDETWKAMMNYGFSNIGSDTILVPELQIVRGDFTPVKDEKIPMPLSSFNSWRPKNLISAMMIQEDFDAAFSTMNNPAILTLKSGKVADNNALASQYPDAIFTSVDEAATVLRTKIYPQVCAGTKSNFTIILTASNKKPSAILPSNLGEPASTMAPDLSTALAQLTDTQKSPDERSELIPGIVKQYFTSDGTIEEMGKSGIRLGIKPAETYLNALILQRSIERLEILEAKKGKENDKYWTIKVIAHHN
jgi:hypothetical protein